MMGMRVSFHRDFFGRRRHSLMAGFCALLLLACSPLAWAEDWSYRIRPGDTIWDLAGEYLKPGIPWQRLQAHNRISNPYQLPPGSTVRIPLAWLHLQPARARVVAVRGQALVDGIGNGGPVPATEGMQLGVGAVLRTARDATLTLEFADRTRLLLQGESQLRLDRLSQYGKSGMVDTRLRLQRGRITNSVTPSHGASPAFIVDTPNATSAVRGTRFRVSAEESRTHTEVTEGTVDVGAGSRSALVKRGHGTVVAAGQATPIRVVPLLPAPDLSDIPATLNGARAEVKWRAQEQAQRYRVQASNTDTFDTLLADLETTDALARLPALQEGTYFLRVRAIDAQGLEGYDATARFVAETLPEPPFAIAPKADSLVREAQPEFLWADVAGAAAYRLELADNAGFQHPLSLRQEKVSRLRAPQALAPGRYYWRIASDASDGRQGSYSDPMAFTVQPLPEAGEIKDESDDSHNVTFHWRAGEAGQRYRFQLSRSPDFKNKRIDQVVDQARITLPRLRAGTWYLRAQAIGSDGFEAPFPPAQRVKVPCGLCKGMVAGGMLWILLAL